MDRTPNSQPNREQIAVMMTRMIPEGDHWIWPGPFNRDLPAYGRRRWSPRRIMWMEMNGEVPKGKVIVGTCDRKDCINPMHAAAQVTHDFLPVKTPIVERLLRRMEVEGECWTHPTQWIHDEDGSTRSIRSVAAELWLDGEPETKRWRKVTCGNKLCFNPDHLVRIEDYVPPRPEFPSTSLLCVFDHLVVGDNMVRVRNKGHHGFKRACRVCRDEYDQHVMDMEILVDPREKLRAKFLQQRAMAKA